MSVKLTTCSDSSSHFSVSDAFLLEVLLKVFIDSLGCNFQNALFFEFPEFCDVGCGVKSSREGLDDRILRDLPWELHEWKTECTATALAGGIQRALRIVVFRTDKTTVLTHWQSPFPLHAVPAGLPTGIQTVRVPPGAEPNCQPTGLSPRECRSPPVYPQKPAGSIPSSQESQNSLSTLLNPSAWCLTRTCRIPARSTRR